jgi:hypothetical protein
MKQEAKNAKNAAKWRVTGFQWIQRHQLAPHPEAEVPMAEEDDQALRDSVSGNGLIQPLLVMERAEEEPGKKAAGRCIMCDDKGFCTNDRNQGGGFRCFRCEDFKPAPAPKQFWIVDGIHRFRNAPEGEPLPCVLVETDDVRGLALECASVGRSRSAGQRILVRLERDKAQILAAAEMGREANLKQSEVSRETSEKIKDFRADAIARELGVSNKDTLLAIELLRCHEERCGRSTVVGGIRRKGRKLEEGDPELAAIDDAWGRVLAGTLPIRRWTAAMAGAAKTKGVGKAATDWLVVGNRAIASLRGVLCDHWSKLPLDDRLGLLERLRDIAADLPQEVREIFAGN